ncbi:MAG: hypothetical protein M3063_12335 [Actinomycetota bacterium]|nr:hypothetical protein [Actinomycetota bacterium]
MVLDVFAGELRLETDVAIRRRTRRDSTAPWQQVADRHHVMFRFAPAAGKVAGSAVVHAPLLDDPVWGRSQLCTPAVLRLFIDDSKRAVTPVGRRVKQLIFADCPPFVFNTVACVGAVDPDAAGLYSDPLSHWFNVFFGYYQVDCAKSHWSRPFAYRSADGAASAVEPDDIVRLGAADWNWFSNWVYGIPGDVALSHSSVPTDEIAVSQPCQVDIGGRRWHQLRITGVRMASCYQAGGGEAGRLVHNSAITGLWRRAFGLPHPRAQVHESFVATSLETVCELCYWEDGTGFHTMVFGATAIVGTDPGFIDAQQAALHRVIIEAYPTMGF